MLSKEEFGKFYVSIRRGQRGEFIARLVINSTISYNTWRSKLVKWSKGEVDDRPLPFHLQELLEELITDQRWESVSDCAN